MTGPRQGRSPTDSDRHPLAAAETRVEAEPEAGTRPRRVEESGGEFREPPLPTSLDEESGPNRPVPRLEETSLGARGAESALGAERKEDEGLAIAAADAAVSAAAQPPPASTLSWSALPASAAMEPPVASPSIAAEQPTSRREEAVTSADGAPPAEARVNDSGGGAARSGAGVRDGAGGEGRSITLKGMMRIALELGQAAARACPPWRSRTKAGTCITSHDLRSVFMNQVEPDSEANTEVVFPGGATFHPSDRYPELYLEEDPDAIITYRWDMCLVSELPRFLEPIEEELGQQHGREPR